MESDRLSRRKFLLQSLGSAGTLAWFAGPGRLSKADVLLQRRHLINIQCMGGVDSLWFQNGVRNPTDLGTPLPRGAIYSDSTGSADLSRYRVTYTGRDSLGNSYSDRGDWHQRYASRDVIEMNGRVLGPGMEMFRNDLSKILIWRGLQSNGGHGGGNQMINLGTSTSGYPSYCALVASALASNPLPLHHVQLAATGALRTSTGNLSGPADPIPIPDLDKWRLMTTGIGLPSDQNMLRLLSDTVNQSGQEASRRAALQRSKEVYQEFLRNFRTSMSVATGGLHQQFLDSGLVEIYQNALSPAPGASGIVASVISGKQTFINFRNAMGVSAAPTAAIAQRFALAEFLITQNLSAVVDIHFPVFMDHHDQLDTHVTVMIMAMVAFKLLMSRLEAANCLQYTTMMMTTEFDRDPKVSHGTDVSIDRPGTNHWETGTSLIMAGRGVVGGRIVGDFKRSEHSGFNMGYYHGLPIDLRTGQPDLNGRICSIRNILPTVLSIFDCSSRNQITETIDPVPAVYQRS